MGLWVAASYDIRKKLLAWLRHKSQNLNNEDETENFHVNSFSHFVRTNKTLEILSRNAAVAMTKRLLYDIDADTYHTAVEKGVEINARARMTDDCKKGIAKFLEK